MTSRLRDHRVVTILLPLRLLYCAFGCALDCAVLKKTSRLESPDLSNRESSVAAD
jgi:hypothetical protein